jgi:6-phosphogluconolactonase (cycloisomerase 2 family)
MRRNQYVPLIVVIAFSATAFAEDGQWVALWQDAYKGIAETRFDPERMSANVAVDRTTGDAYLSMWNLGIWKSSDEGKTFARVDGGKISGGGCGPIQGLSFYIHPEGQKLVTFNMNNGPGPSGFSIDGGKTWESYEAVGRNWDFGATDWYSGVVFAARHEDDGLHLSSDKGKTWTRLARSRGPISGLCVLGKTLFLATAGSIERSDDEGKTWSKVAAISAVGPAVNFKGKTWWLSQSRRSVAVSADQGTSWSIQGEAAPGLVDVGPFFGKDENHIILAGKGGFYETIDGCKSWKLAVPAPEDYKLSTAAYDPVHDIFYATGTGLPCMKFVRGKKPEYQQPTAAASTGPKCEFVETAKAKVRCIVPVALAMNGSFFYAAGEDGILIFKRDTQNGKLNFIEQIQEFKCGGYSIACAGGKLYAATPHEGSKRMPWKGLAWFDLDPQSGRPTRKGIVECPGVYQMIVGPEQKDLYMKSCTGNQDRIFWYHIGDDGQPVKSGEVTGKGIGPSPRSDYPGIFQLSPDGKNLYTLCAKDYAIACIERKSSGEIVYKSAVSLDPVVARDRDDGFQWISLGLSGDGTYLYASVRNGKPTNNFYGIFKRNADSGELTFQETVSGEKDALANMKGWHMKFAPAGTNGYLGNYGPLMTFTYDAATGHLSNAREIKETVGNESSHLVLDAENGILYVGGREFCYDRIFSFKADKKSQP